MKCKHLGKSILICTLALILLTSAACADSLFDFLPEDPTPSPAPQSSVAPSYGDFAGVMVDEETVNDNGDAVITYYNVSAQQMQDFGVALKQQGYVVEVEQEQDGVKAYQLSNNIFSFILFYNMAEQSLKTVYPKGTEYATSLFPGYTKVYLGDTFKIKGLGEFTFDSIEFMNEQFEFSYSYFIQSTYYRTRGELIEIDISSASPGMLIKFSYYNTDVSAKTFYKRWLVDESNSLIQKIICFLNMDDNTYTYTSDYYGGFYEGKLHLDSQGGSISSLEEQSLAVFYALPTGALNSTDGTLAMTMDFPNGEKYVLMLRENGVNLF